MKYDRLLDQFIGHAGTGISKGWPAYELDEIELGGRVAMALYDDDQWWFEIYRTQIERDLA